MCAADLFLPQHQPQDWLKRLPLRRVGCWCGGANAERRHECRVWESWAFGRPPGIFYFHLVELTRAFVVADVHCRARVLLFIKLLHFTLSPYIIIQGFWAFIEIFNSSSLYIKRDTVLMIYNTKPYKILKNIALQHVKHCQRFFSTPAPLP